MIVSVNGIGHHLFIGHLGIGGLSGVGMVFVARQCKGPLVYSVIISFPSGSHVDDQLKSNL